MHVENRYYIRPGVIEVEQVHTSMLGNHNRRSAREKLTEDVIKKNNQKRAAKQLRRLIDTNFQPGDLYITLTYRKGTDKSLKDVRKDRTSLLGKLKRRYKKIGEELKWIAVEGVKSPHIHMIIQNVGIDYMTIMPALWSYGHVHMEPLYIEEGRYMQLAEYLVKHKAENEKKLGISLKGEKAWGGSRNLKRPKVKRVRISEKVIIRAPKIPSGYRLDDNTEVQEGVSEYTGYHWRYFFLLRKVKKRE